MSDPTALSHRVGRASPRADFTHCTVQAQTSFKELRFPIPSFGTFHNITTFLYGCLYGFFYCFAQPRCTETVFLQVFRKTFISVYAIPLSAIYACVV